jgi:hypothetical protein
MNRYEKAYRWLFNKLPNWKRLAIQEDRKAGKDSSVLTAFIQEVAKLAEQPGKIPSVVNLPEYDLTGAKALTEVPDWHTTNGANGN